MWFDIEAAHFSTGCMSTDAALEDHHKINFDVRHIGLATPVRLSSGGHLHDLEGFFEIRRRRPFLPDARGEDAIVGGLDYNKAYGGRAASYDAWIEVTESVFDRLWVSETARFRCTRIDLLIEGIRFDQANREEIWDVGASETLGIQRCTFHFDRPRRKGERLEL